jgi:hypothetical protein
MEITQKAHINERFLLPTQVNEIESPDLDFIENTWIPALRSDKYKQVPGMLEGYIPRPFYGNESATTDEIGDCCLGVLVRERHPDAEWLAGKEVEKLLDSDKAIGVNFIQSPSDHGFYPKINGVVYATNTLPTFVWEELNFSGDASLTVMKCSQLANKETRLNEYLIGTEDVNLVEWNDGGASFGLIANRLEEICKNWREFLEARDQEGAVFYDASVYQAGGFSWEAE